MHPMSGLSKQPVLICVDVNVQVYRMRGARTAILSAIISSSQKRLEPHPPQDYHAVSGGQGFIEGRDAAPVSKGDRRLGIALPTAC